MSWNGEDDGRINVYEESIERSLNKTELDNKELKVRIKELEQALKFYADQDNWSEWNLNDRFDGFVIDDSDESFETDQGICGGKRAREVLGKKMKREGICG